MARWDVLLGDCLDVLASMPANSVDSVVTDPPYNLTSITKRFGKEGSAPAQYGTDGAFARVSKGFMGQLWDGDGVAFRADLWEAVYRVLKPGGYVLACGGTRTEHRMTCAIEDAGFDIRDKIAWCYGTGFPKSHNISKHLDRMAGAEREVVGMYTDPDGITRTKRSDGIWSSEGADSRYITAPATPAAQQWSGWGTALKPAMEIIVMARKPLAASTVAGNVLAWGTGAIHVDACRISITPSKGDGWRPNCYNKEYAYASNGQFLAQSAPRTATPPHDLGRWPANVLFSHHDLCGTIALDGVESWQCVGNCPVRELDRQSGVSTDRAAVRNHSAGKQGYHGNPNAFQTMNYGDSGGASRYFTVFDPPPFIYQSKPSRRERDRGLPEGERNIHPTLKPVTLMAYLIRLVTPLGGTVLDPFCGSGSTGMAAAEEGMQFIGIEKEAEYHKISMARVGYAYDHATMPLPTTRPLKGNSSVYLAKGRKVQVCPPCNRRWHSGAKVCGKCNGPLEWRDEHQERERHGENVAQEALATLMETAA